MIFIRRRRFIFWVIRAYVKRLKKIMLLSFVVGLLVFVVLKFSAGFVVSKIPTTDEKRVGINGAFTIDSLPQEIVGLVSMGLTKIDQNGKIAPGAAREWKVEQDGKRYTFLLKQNLLFSDDTELTSEEVNYSFSDVKIEKPNKSTIVFTLKDRYSPFLVTVSRSIFKDKLEGLGEYELTEVGTNGSFVESMDLVKKDERKILRYQFYPTEEAVKTAFVMGEINVAQRLTNTMYKNMDIAEYKNISLKKSVNDERLVTLFFNTQDEILSEKKIRTALSYLIPSNFSAGKRNSTPFSPGLWVSEGFISQYETQDLEHAGILLKDTSVVGAAKRKLIIKTLPQYEKSAREIVKEWQKAGVGASVEVVDSVPTTFQIFLGDFKVPRDPDQYTLWHSAQHNNISRYKNLRIDKLLEDGRKELNMEERKRIYEDFQKYLLDDAPAAFLYFPYYYELERN